MRYWFVPCASGDFRLTALTDEVCRLTVENPTIEDYQLIQPFLAVMVEMGWVPGGKAIVKPEGLTTIDVRVSIAVAGPMLVGSIHARGDTWTGVRRESGRVYVNDGVDTTPPPEPAKETALVPAAPSLPDPPQAAVTIRPPARGCPAPTPCQRRASEILRTFSTEAQWSSWNSRGRMHVIGNTTGARYTLFHRDEASARGLGHILLAPEAVEGPRRWLPVSREVCVWDQKVPPEEEALAVKLAVEHRESWLLEGSDPFPG